MKIWLFRFYIILLHYYNSVFVRLQLLRLVPWLWFATPYISDRLWLTFLSLCPETFLWKNIRLLSSAIHQQCHQQFPKDKVKIFIRNKTFVALKVFTNYFIILFFLQIWQHYRSNNNLYMYLYCYHCIPYYRHCKLERKINEWNRNHRIDKFRMDILKAS